MSTQPPITPEVGKRYVTRGGWVTPPMEKTQNPHFPFGYKVGPDILPYWTINGKEKISGGECYSDLVAEYVEPTVTDTFRRDLIARLYCEFVRDSYSTYIPFHAMAEMAIEAADTLINAMGVAK